MFNKVMGRWVNAYTVEKEIDFSRQTAGVQYKVVREELYEDDIHINNMYDYRKTIARLSAFLLEEFEENMAIVLKDCDTNEVVLAIELKIDYVCDSVKVEIK